MRGSGAILAFFVGSGFASGQEVLQFFGAYGTGRAISGIGLSMLLLFFCMRMALQDGGRLAYEDTSQMFVHYCGPYVGFFFKWMTPIFLFLSYCVMLAGSSAILWEYFGCPLWVGRILMLLLSLGTVLLGLSRLIDIMGFLGPIVVGMVFLLGGLSLGKNPGDAWWEMQEVQQLGMKGAANTWWWSAVLYAGFSVMISIPFLGGLGQQLKQEEQEASAFLGGGTFLAGTILICLGLLANLAEIAEKKVPTIYLAQQLFPGAGLVFAAIIFVEIYTTAVPMLWTICNKLAPSGRGLRFFLTTVGVVIAAWIWGSADFSFLIGTVYPYIGFFGVIVMIYMGNAKVRKARAE